MTREEFEENELSKPEFDEIIRQSKSIEPFKPTYEDIVRFCSQGTRLLIEADCYNTPLDIKIMEVLADGAIFKVAIGFFQQHLWVKTQEVTVLHIYSPASLIERVKAIELAEKRKAQKKDQAEVQGVLDKHEQARREMVGTILDMYWGQKNLKPKPKKAKKKKSKDEQTKRPES